MAEPIPAPNYTQIPNVIFDLMADKSAHLTEAELRVVMAIARKTFGWHKKRDKISLSQLVELTAMSKTSVISGLEAAVARGLIRRTPDKDDRRGGVFYELVVDESSDQTSTKSEPVQNLNQYKILTKTSTKSEPDLVQNLNTQKKEKEKKERECEKRAQESPARTPAVVAYFDSYPDETLDADQIADINSTVTDLARWQEVLRYWKGNGHRSKSVMKMLDRYSSGRTARDERPASGNTNGQRPADARPPPPVFVPTADRPAARTSARLLADEIARARKQ